MTAPGEHGNSRRVVVGMSGGVDSAVAALLLQRQGYDPVGVFMKNWEEEDETGGLCTATQDYDDVRRVCDCIGMPYYTVNFAKEYRERVFSYLLSESRAGRTPNPDILCNTEIKFKAFLDFALSLDAAYVATGHYARLDRAHGQPRLLRGADAGKDQSYFLAGLTASQLERVLFPIGGLQKVQVRRIAGEARLPNAHKKDSTGICFIGERNFKHFLMQYLPARPGEMVSLDGRVVGRHDGLMYYTLGQRRGLGIGGSSTGTGESWFVIAKDIKNNRLIVQQGEQDELFSTALVAAPVNWVSGTPPASPLDCTVKIRYRQQDQPARAFLETAGWRVQFARAQRAVTPGQWVVFYRNEECLGGGPIESNVPKKSFCLP